ncbi:MAG: hypothetical protein HY072_08850 [Deltaproteobacteria bacterium]|nr:hypothetical protein [Deltaproteobacteria bacterium]
MRSSTGSNILLSKAKAYLEDSMNTHVEYSRGRIDPFSTVHFENFKLTRNNKNEQVEIIAKEIDIHYSVSFFSRKVVIERILVDHPTVFYSRVEPVEAKTSQPQKSWEFLVLPVQVSVKQFEIKSMDLDLNKESALSTLKSKIRDLNLRFGFEIVPSSLTSAGEFSLSDTSSVVMISKKHLDSVRDSVFETFLSASAKWSTSVHPQEKKWILGFEGVAKLLNMKYGKWELQSRMQVEGQSTDFLSGTGTSTLTQNQLFSEPITINHKVNLKSEKIELEMTANLPSLEVKKVAKFQDTQILATVRSPNVFAAKDLDFSLKIKQGLITFAKEFVRRSYTLKNGLNLTMGGTIRDRARFNLDEFSADFNNSLVRLSAEATGKVKEKEFQTKGQLTLDIPKDFPSIAGTAIRGRIEFPWTLSIIQGRLLAFRGDIDVFNLDWSKENLHVTGISGKIPVSEKLLWDGKKIKFEHLIIQNPFERVDYERLRPLINGAARIRFEEIGFENMTYGPFVGFFSVDQNVISAHQFDFTLGSTGRTYGEMYFDLYPANLQMGFLARLTEVNLKEVMPKKYLTKIPQEEKNLSGRLGIVLNLNKGSIDGRMDITEIGRGQLLALINVLDPKYQNDKMNMARSKLGLAYPTFVTMVFQNGYMDMSVQLSLADLNAQIRGIPISTWISSATSKTVKKSQEGFLK